MIVSEAFLEILVLLAQVVLLLRQLGDFLRKLVRAVLKGSDGLEAKLKAGVGFFHERWVEIF